MGKLSIYLPPFTGDYSAVCSALFEYNCLIVIVDAACCTRNYVDYDEPRWGSKKKSTFCAQLRSLEAIMGDDSRIINLTCQGAKDLNPDFVAVLGSPVPSIIGLDVKGIAMEVEAQTGIPSIGFETTGFRPYDYGLELAGKALLERFVGNSEVKVPNGVNILGMTPLDFGANGNSLALKQILTDNGFQVICSFFMETSLDDVKQASSAQVNLVVSHVGLKMAKAMEEKFNIPYVVGVPVGEKYRETVVELLNDAIITGKNHWGVIPPTAVDKGKSILIVGEGVLAGSFRSAIRLLGEKQQITIASFFEIPSEYREEGDVFLDCEKDLSHLLKSGRFHKVIGDPLLKKLPAAKGLQFIDVPHPVISGNLHWEDVLPIF